MTTTISHYSHLSVTFTSTSAKWFISEFNTKWFTLKMNDKENEYNDYDMKSMNNECVDVWKEKEHKYH